MNTREITGKRCRLGNSFPDQRWTRVVSTSKDMKAATLEEKRGGYYHWSVEDLVFEEEGEPSAAPSTRTHAEDASLACSVLVGEVLLAKSWPEVIEAIHAIKKVRSMEEKLTYEGD